MVLGTFEWKESGNFFKYKWVLSLLIFVIKPCTLFKVYSLYCKCIHELHWNSWYLNVKFLLQQDLHWVLWPVLICNEQCIKMMHMLPFHLKEPLKKLILHSFLDMMQRIPRLSYNFTALTKWSPRIWTSAMIHFGVVPDGGLQCCCCIDTWHVVQFTCQILCQVGLKPLEKHSTNCTSITRRWHPCWLRLFEEWWEQSPIL